MQHQGIFVLGPLNEKDHQKSNDGGAGVDEELPSFRIVEQGPGHSPHHHNARCAIKAAVDPENLVIPSVMRPKKEPEDEPKAGFADEFMGQSWVWRMEAAPPLHATAR